MRVRMGKCTRIAPDKWRLSQGDARTRTRTRGQGGTLAVRDATSTTTTTTLRLASSITQCVAQSVCTQKITANTLERIFNYNNSFGPACPCNSLSLGRRPFISKTIPHPQPTEPEGKQTAGESGLPRGASTEVGKKTSRRARARPLNQTGEARG